MNSQHTLSISSVDIPGLIILETSSSTKIVKKDSKSADDTEDGTTAQDDPNAEVVEEDGSKTQTDI